MTLRQARESRAAIRREVVALILTYRKQGDGYSAIADRLTRDGVATFAGGKRWYAVTVRGIVLANSERDAALATARRVTDEGTVYACGTCGEEGSASEMVLSSHTGARYCSDYAACVSRRLVSDERNTDESLPDDDQERTDDASYAAGACV